MKPKARQPAVVRETPPAYGVVVADRGRLVLPAPLRKRLAIKKGDRLTVTVEDDGSVRMVNRLDIIRQLRGIWRPYSQGRSIVAELLAERRREAKREDEE